MPVIVAFTSTPMKFSATVPAPATATPVLPPAIATAKLASSALIVCSEIASTVTAPDETTVDPSIAAVTTLPAVSFTCVRGISPGVNAGSTGSR